MDPRSSITIATPNSCESSLESVVSLATLQDPEQQAAIINKLFNVSPSTSPPTCAHQTMAQLVNVSGAAAAATMANNNNGPRRCTVPYERPTLKPLVGDQKGGGSGDNNMMVLKEDVQNANVVNSECIISASDSNNNNSSSGGNLIIDYSDSIRDTSICDNNSNCIVTSNNDNHHQQQQQRHQLQLLQNHSNNNVINGRIVCPASPAAAKTTTTVTTIGSVDNGATMTTTAAAAAAAKVTTTRVQIKANTLGAGANTEININVIMGGRSNNHHNSNNNMSNNDKNNNNGNFAEQKDSTTTVIHFQAISNCGPNCRNISNNTSVVSGLSSTNHSNSNSGNSSSSSDAAVVAAAATATPVMTTSPSKLFSRTVSEHGSSSNGKLLSNCLSALNFVSGNRISGHNGGAGGSKTAAAGIGAVAMNCSDVHGHLKSEQKKHKSSPSGFGGKSAKLSKSAGHQQQQQQQGGGCPSQVHACTTAAAAGSSTSTAAAAPTKTKRSNWPFGRFSCGKLKSSKSSSNLKAEVVCKCPEKPVPVAVTSQKSLVSSASASALPISQSSSTTTIESNAFPNPEIIVLDDNDIIIDLTTPIKSQQVQLQPIQGIVQKSGGEVSADGGSVGGEVQQDDAGTYSREDCDEWARQKREREIEDGVEAPPGYMPHRQKGTSASAGSSSGSSNNGVVSGNGVGAGGGPSAIVPSNAGLPRANMNIEEAFRSTGWPMSFVNNFLKKNVNPHWPHVWLMTANGVIDPFEESGEEEYEQGDEFTEDSYMSVLVPDLQQITSCSCYWGKMDRYQAEKLLDNKPEGTFLLRDSAQDDFLFSVSFRKYGRSLHARIEQFNHQFSFDSHDPGVYTAKTVTGLLEHYKDPACVMFFEPMLSHPLNRNFCFSLQQLCRATIVSQTTYEQVDELGLPNMLKGYLKEYHYKQKLRVKRREYRKAV